jgi:hypothetical protein
MKNRLMYVMVTVAVLIGLVCFWSDEISMRLPGNDVDNSQLAQIWAANTNPGPEGSSGCIYTTPKTNCKTAASGTECGEQEFIKPGDVTCTGYPTSTKYSQGREKCFSTAITVKTCSFSGSAILTCSGTKSVTPTLERTYCRISGGSFPHEP